MMTARRHLQRTVLLSCFLFTIFRIKESLLAVPKDPNIVTLFPSLASTWTTCRIALSHQLRPLQQRWYNDGYPVLQSVVIQGLEARIVFAVHHMPDYPPNKANKRQRYQELQTAKWLCNSQEPARPLGDDWQFKTLTLICPSQDLKYIDFSLDAKTINETYSLSKHMECEQTYPIPFPSDSKLALCTMIRQAPRLDVLQWIEYHRLIGFDSFIFYVNEDYYNGTRELPKDDPRIVYIPWDYQVRVKIQKAADEVIFSDKRSDFFHQRVQQNDCIYRTAQRGFPWVALTDIDEYIRVSANETSLLDFLDRYTVRGEETFSGIKMKNRFYGGKNGTEELKLDYVWKHPTTSGWRWRTKLILHPDQVDYINVHLVGSGKQPRGVDGDVELVHYKNAHLGVFHEPTERGLDFLHDTSFRDAYRSKLVERLKKYS